VSAPVIVLDAPARDLDAAEPERFDEAG